MRILAIDPGLKGRAVFIDSNKRTAILYKLIFFGDNVIFDSADFYGFSLKLNPDVILLEKLMCNQGDVRFGRKMIFNFGERYGQIKNAVALCGKKYELVAPKTWQSKIHQKHHKGSAKEKTMQAYHELYPGDPIPKYPRQTKINADAVDALMMASWGLLTYSDKGLEQWNWSIYTCQKSRPKK